MDLPKKAGHWIRKSESSNIYYYDSFTSLLASVGKDEIVFGTACPCGAVIARKKITESSNVEKILEETDYLSLRNSRKKSQD